MLLSWQTKSVDPRVRPNRHLLGRTRGSFPLLHFPVLTHLHSYNVQEFRAMFEYHSIHDINCLFYYLQCSESLSHSLISNVVPSSWMSWLHPCRKMTVALLAVAALMEKMSCGSNILYDNILLNLVLNSPNIISLSLCVILIANGLDDSGRPFRIIVINSPSLRVSSACLNHICETITPVEQSHL